MPNWKKVIVSGSSAHLNQITSSADINLSGNSLLDFNYSAQTVQGNVTASSAAHTIVVKVISKTSSHPYINLGSSSGYSLDGIESPWLNLTEGIYKFDVSDGSVGSHPFRFYFDAAKTQQYTANVDTSESGAVYLTVNKDTPQVLYYQCSSHGYMGFGLSTGMNPLVQDENGLRTLVSGSAQITHDNTTGFVANEHIDHSGVSISTGTGLTGGGDITSTRTLSVDFSDSTLQTTISGSFTEASSSISTRLTAAESELGNTLISSSVQLASDISGSWRGELSSSVYLRQVATTISGSITSTSSSIASDIATNLSNISTLTSKTGSYATTGSNHFKANQTISGSLTVTDTIIAQEFKTEFVSASITFTSGSTKFGDSLDDVHNMTGSLKISGSINASTYIGVLSQSTQIASDISGSFNSVSSSIASDIAEFKDGTVTLVSGSSLSTGSFGKLFGDASDLTNLPSAAITSYSSTGDNRIVTSVNATDVQGEANLTFDGTSLTLTGNMTASGDISGSSTSTGSFGVIEVGGGHFTSASLASGGTSADAASISGSWRGALSGSLNLISGSSLSTGSFGLIQVGGGDFTSASLASGGSGTGFPFSGSAVITGSMFISGSTTSIETLGHVSGSSTSTASFGRFEGDGSGLSNIAAAIDVSDEGSSLTSTVSSINFVGDNVTATNSGNDVTVTLNNTNSTGDAKVINVSSAATTWAVTHSLATKYPVVTIWDDNDQVIIPASITADTTNTATITFEQAMSGRASFTLGVPSSSYFISESNQILTTVADSTIAGDLTVTGILTAQEFHTEYTSASIIYTSGSNKFGDTTDDTHEFTGSLNITGSLISNGLTYPTADGTTGQTLQTDASGNLTLDDPQVLFDTVKNKAGYDLTKGTPVFASGSTGNTPHIYPASASLPLRMPAAYILREDITNDSEGQGLITGFVNGIDTSGFDEGDTLYIGADGGYTNQKPSGSNLIQNIGKAIKIHSSNGSAIIIGAGRSNDTPNLLDNHIFFGSGSNQMQQLHISGALDTTVINNVTASGDISGSSTSTFTAATFVGTFSGALSSSAQIASDISGSFSSVSASLASRLDTLSNDIIALSIALG